MDSAAIALNNVTKRFGSHVVLNALSLQVQPGEFFTLLGPSGCGKTTILRLVAGLQQPDGGQVYLSGQDVTRWPPHRRRLGMVFQNYALFPHLTVFENVAYGLRARRTDRSAIKPTVEKYLDMVGLLAHSGKRPHQLSGGQQQRVALARALAVETGTVLFDEPLSNLDVSLRADMQREIKNLHQELGFTALYVTHDHEEAIALSDRLCVLNEGRIQQLGEPALMFMEPANPFVAEFFGYTNKIPGHLEGSDDAGWFLRLPGDHRLPVPRVAAGARTGSHGVLMFHPTQATVAANTVEHGEFNSRATAPGTVTDVQQFGFRWEAGVVLPGGATARISQPLSGGRPPTPGQQVQLLLMAQGPVFYPGADEEAATASGVGEAAGSRGQG